MQLSKIFTYNGIYSKNILKQLGIEYPDKKIMYNGEDNLKDQLIIYNKIKNLLSELKIEIPIVDINGNFIKNKIDENNKRR